MPCNASTNRFLIAALLASVAGLIGCKETTGPRSLSTPTGVTATLVNPVTARITWTANPADEEVGSYNIIRNGTKIGQVTGTSYDDTGLQELTVYRYAISANAADGRVSPPSAESPAATLTAPDVTAPRVISSVPASGEASVSSTSMTSVTFSESLDPATVNSSTVLLRVTSSGMAITGTVTYNSAARAAEFRPAAPLPSNTAITGTITTGIKDVAGNSLAAAHVWSFTVRDENPPVVSSTNPADGASGVSLSSAVFVTFNEPLDSASVTTSSFTISVTSTGASVIGAVRYERASRTAVFLPSAELSPGVRYTARLGTGVRDAAGNALAAPYSWSFTTDNIPSPTVTSVSPAAGATGVAPNSSVSIVFSEEMLPSTINSSSVSLVDTGNGALVASTVGYSLGTRTATIAPTSALSPSTTYRVTVSTSARSVRDVNLSAPFTSTFTTASQSDNTAPTVLGVTPANGADDVSVTASVTITFSEAMNPATINSATLTVSGPTGNVGGLFAYNAGQTAVTFTPGTPLSSSTTYTIRVTTGAQDNAGNGLAQPFTSVFTTAGPTDNVAPTVVATVPERDATGVAVTGILTATFSEPMNPTTINTSTFTLRNNSSGAPVTGIVTWNAGTNTAGFNISSPLANSTSYTATITTGATDVAGNPLGAPYAFTFTTDAPSDNTPPAVSSVLPAAGASNVAVSTGVTITFTEPMNASTLNSGTITLSSSAGNVPGSIAYTPGSTTATFTPSATLANSTTYTLTVTGDATDVAGNRLASPFVSTFTTAAPVDNTAPSVTTVAPASGSTNVAVSTSVTITFSEPMNPSTVNTGTFKLSSSSGDVGGTISYPAGGTAATFTPSSPLVAGTDYTVTVTTGATDVAGNPLASSFFSTFTTAASGSAFNVTGFWSGTDAPGDLHWHVVLDHTGSTIVRRPVCEPATPTLDCKAIPLTAAGQTAIGNPFPLEVTSAPGTYTQPNSVSFTMTLSNGRTFTFVGTVSQSDKLYLDGTISGATLTSRAIRFARDGP